MAGMLDRKVVVISGVGPGLGTTLAHRCAQEGADLVLAARTIERLDDLAKQLKDAGHEAVAVRTDITDDAEVNSLVEAALADLRQGRRAGQQCVPGAVDETAGRHHLSAYP